MKLKPLSAVIIAGLALSGCGLTPAQLAILGQTLSSTGAAMRGQPADTPNYRPSMMCLRAGEVQQGFSKVCTYNCGGSPYAITVEATAICPDHS